MKKWWSGVFVCMMVLSACVAGSNVPHADSPGSEKRDEGPALCRDGTAPPCNDRD